MDVVIDIADAEPHGIRGSGVLNCCRSVNDLERGEVIVVARTPRFSTRFVVELMLLMMCAITSLIFHYNRRVLTFLFALPFILMAVVVILARFAEMASNFKTWLYWLRDWILHHTNNHGHNMSGLWRASFLQTAVNSRRHKVTGNPHERSANYRTTAREFMSSFAARTGLSEFQHQRGLVEEKEGTRGYRRYYWGRDVNTRPVIDTVGDNDVVVMTDVDYYEDMPRYMTTHKNPILLYSFVPSAASRHADTDEAGDYAFTFDAQGYVCMQVSGGTRFSHGLWDYGYDTVSAQRRILGIPWAYSLYAVERINVAHDRQIIGLFPMASWRGPFAWLAWTLGSHRLERLNPVSKGFIRLEVMQTDADGTVKHLMSTGEVGQYSSVTIDVSLDEAIARVSDISKSEIVSPQVQSFIDGDKLGGALLTKYHRTKGPKRDVTVHPAFLGVRAYEFTLQDNDFEAKPAMTPFMSPVIDEGFTPVDSASNDAAAVIGRIKEVESKVKSNAQTERAMDSFIRQFRKRCGLRENDFLQPSTFEEVFDKQDTPAQRRILQMAATSGKWFKNVYRTFMKREAYGDVKDPRIITTFPDSEKLRRSYYSYPLAECCKSMPWYGFGKEPTAVAEAVASLCQRARSHVVKSDYKRWDGHVSACLFEFERRLMLAMYAPSERAIILESLENARNGKCVFDGHHGAKGIWYEAPFARKSGDPFTSVWNTLENAFIAFCTLLRTKRCGVYLTADQAWEELELKGMYGGDDGLTADIDPQLYISTAAAVGQVLEAEPVKRGDTYVSFLARIYGPEVWYGDPNNCCDIRRQLAKLHLSVTMPPGFTPLEKLADKMRGYSQSDRNTPVIGHIVKLFERHAGPQRALPRQFQKKSLKYTAGPYYNEPAAWMHGYLQQSCPDFAYDQFLDWYGDTFGLGSDAGSRRLTEMPLCADYRAAKPQREVIVDCDRQGPKPTGGKPSAGGGRPTRRGGVGAAKTKRQ